MKAILEIALALAVFQAAGQSHYRVRGGQPPHGQHQEFHGGGFRHGPGFGGTSAFRRSSAFGPWEGSISYERKRAEAYEKSANFQAKQNAMFQQDAINYEIERNRARFRVDRRQAEREADLREAKAEAKSARYEAELDRREILQENRDTIRRRAAEQEARRGW